MFSGGDSSDGINSLNQFGSYGFVNKVAVSNAVAAGQNIDWAQLAQQWIQMRDNSGLEPKTEAEPPANKAVHASSNCCKFEEKGEADMDMDDEEQIDEKTRYNSMVPSSSDVGENLHQSWYFGETNSKLASRSTSNNQWNTWQNEEILTTSLPSKNRPINPTAHIPSLLKMSVPNPNEMRVFPDISVQSDTTNVMDAAKKKVLPAWIREGLEKMEREKQKLLEKEQQNKDTNLSGEDHASNKNRTKSIESLHPPTILDDDSTDNENSITVKGMLEKDEIFKEVNDEDACNSIVNKTYEQKLSDLMIVVRHTLTELLLETTNEEISKVADETIKIFKSKASSAQVIRKSALSTLTDKLGLAAYGDSSSENDSGNEESYLSKKISDHPDSGNDSEDEIRNTIRQKRRAFIKISEEIEERVTASAAQEEEKLKYFLRKEEDEREHSRRKKERVPVIDSSNSGHVGHNNIKGYEKDFGEITETKIQHINGKRPKDRSSRRERITRFSDNKDKSMTIPNAATFLTNVNSATNFINVNNTSSLATNSQRQNVPDINGLLPNYASTGMANALSAADAALEKALKGKPSTNLDKQNQRYERDRVYNQLQKRRLSEKNNSRSKSSSSSTSSSSSSTSSDSTSSSSRSSHHSKYKRRSAKKHKSHTSNERQSEKSNRRGRKDGFKYSSSSYKSRDRSIRTASSDSEDDYRRRRRAETKHSRNRSQKRSSTSSTYDRDREHSRSQSRSSYSSNNRRQ